MPPKSVSPISACSRSVIVSQSANSGGSGRPASSASMPAATQGSRSVPARAHPVRIAQSATLRLAVGPAVGLTIVAGGTSLPELMTAAQAARRGESELVVGNVLGSNIINALGIGGVVGVLAPGGGLGRGIAVGAVAMCAASLVALLFMRRRFVVDRLEA